MRDPPPDVTPIARPPGLTAADFAVAALFLAVPLAASTGFWDQFTTVKWYTLETLTVAWFLMELWRCRSCGWPAFVKKRWTACACLLLGALVLLGSLRAGVAWAAPALLDRVCFVLLALASYWYFRRNQGWTGAAAWGACVALAFVVVVGLAQTMGWNPLSSLTAGDQRSAFFGNVNLTAQFLGLAVIFALAGFDANSSRRTWIVVVRATLATASFVYLYFLSCRSVFLALGAALVVLLASGRLTARSVARMVGAATAGTLLLIHLGPALGRRIIHLLTPEVMANKALSTEMRLAVWGGTLRLIRDHPLGVGSGNFGDAFIPYQLGLGSIPGESLLFRTPHNEYLRTLAEEGLVFGVLAAAVLVLLLRRLHAAVRSGRTNAAALLWAGIAFVAVESCFQFPLGTAFGCLTAAVLLGLAVAELQAPGTGTGGAVQSRRSLLRWQISGTIAVAGSLVVLGSVVASELLFVGHRRDAGAQATACRLNARNLPACVTAAWLQAQVGRRSEARALLVRSLRYSPYYHPAIRLLGEVATADGDRQAGCLYLWVYDALFRERSAVHGRVGLLCGNALPAAVAAGVTVPYYGILPLASKDVSGR